MKIARSVAFCLSVLVTATTSAQTDFTDDLPKVEPSSPQQSLAKLRLRDGFRAELVAAEPLVRDPVAVDFDEDGRMYVVELPPYNSYVIENFDQHGSIRLLEDTDDDGLYDKSVVFAGDLTYPTAVACWDGGVFVGDAPDLLYLKDTDGDGKSDERTVIMTGFGSDKAGEAHLNSIRWGFDNRFHFSTNLSGGDVKPVENAKADVRPVSVRGRGIVFDPRNPGTFELASGGGQHGMSMDNWGRKFVCSNSVPAQTLMYDDRYVARNPHVQAPATAVDIAPDGKFTKLFRISPSEPWRVLRTRLRREGKFRGSDEGGKPFGFFTGATGITIYRGDAWPDEFRGNLIVGDVANNLIYRARLESRGVELVAHRADPDAEFAASTDIWFRPVQFANAPDGSLVVLDMYRELIEGAAFLPPEFMEYLNAVGGNDRGRIYRIVPSDFERRSRPQLSRATAEELVALIDHPNGWHRDTASRLIYQRQDLTAAPLLRTLVVSGRRPEGRMTALYCLDGLGVLDEPTLSAALGDAHDGVRAQAIRISERHAAEFASVGARVFGMTKDDSPGVRYQLAFSLGDIPGAGQESALADLAVRDGDDPWMRLAILSSTKDCGGRVFDHLASIADFRESDHGRDLLVRLAGQIGAANRSSQMASFLKALAAIPAAQSRLRESLVRAVVEKQPPGDRRLVLAADGGEAGTILTGLLKSARETASDDDLSERERVEAIRSLRLATFDDVQLLLGKLMDLKQPPAVRSAAISTFGAFSDGAVVEQFCSQWPTMSPALRAQAAEAVFSRPSWLSAFLQSIDDGEINRADIDPARVALLKQHPDASIRKQVSRVFANSGVSQRQNVVAEYQSALKLAGNAERGRTVFRRNCASCHRLEGFGTAVGADLKGIGERGPAGVMLNILDPNREVKPKFQSYVLQTDEGRVLTGMIVNENANSITLQQPDGKTLSVQRGDIDTMRSSGLSFMPEGLEKQVTPRDMADLLEYLNSAAN